MEAKIVKVESIYNAKNYFIFNLEYHVRSLKLKQDAENPPQLVFAFHGFGKSKLVSIMEEGLHLYFSKEGVFSRGIYVSTSADVCDSYYTTTTDGKTKQLLFCLVQPRKLLSINHRRELGIRSTVSKRWNSAGQRGVSTRWSTSLCCTFSESSLSFGDRNLYLLEKQIIQKLEK